MWRIARRYGILVVLAAVAAMIGVYSVNRLMWTQQQRVEYERYLYRALDSCRSGSRDMGYGLLLRARSYAPNEADDDYARELIPKFRAGDCNLPGVTKPSDVELGAP